MHVQAGTASCSPVAPQRAQIALPSWFHQPLHIMTDTDPVKANNKVMGKEALGHHTDWDFNVLPFYVFLQIISLPQISHFNIMSALNIISNLALQSEHRASRQQQHGEVSQYRHFPLEIQCNTVQEAWKTTSSDRRRKSLWVVLTKCWWWPKQRDVFGVRWPHDPSDLNHGLYEPKATVQA